jgi:HPt (histidine-containing phosphotransfer) domain-containing protein
MEAGFDDHIGKPIRRDDLFLKMREWLPETTDEAGSANDVRSGGEQAFKERHFAEFRNTIGADRVSQWLKRLDEQLSTTFASDEFVSLDRRTIAKAAHAMTSQAALLGFSELAEFCTVLEQECGAGGDIGATLEKACQAARAAREVIANMNAFAPA